MGLFDFFDIFKSETSTMREKIIFTQKNRISAIERELEELKRTHSKKEDEINRIRETHERAKERLIEQIIGLSDKFANINDKMLDIAHENARLKLMLETRKKGRK